MINVSVFCASSQEVDSSYLMEAFKVGRLLVENHYGIIYGGGSVGLMGAVADGALSFNGSQITGVIPDFMHEMKLGHETISELIVVDGMHSREAMMLLKADFITVLPGGVGTFSELFQALAWKQLGLINAQIIIVNVNNYFDRLIKMIHQSIDQKFMKEDFRNFFYVVNNAEEAIDFIKKSHEKL